MEEDAYIRRWASVVGESLASELSPASSSNRRVPRNAALALLRDAVGGPDLTRASANLTVEMDERWMDDTSVIVLRF